MDYILPKQDYDLETVDYFVERIVPLYHIQKM